MEERICQAEDSWIRYLNEQFNVNNIVNTILEHQYIDYPINYIGHCYYADMSFDTQILRYPDGFEIIGGKGSDYPNPEGYLLDHMPKVGHYNVWFIGDVKRDGSIYFACLIYLPDRHLLLFYQPIKDEFSQRKLDKIKNTFYKAIFQDFYPIDPIDISVFSQTFVLMFLDAFASGLLNEFLWRPYDGQEIIMLKRWIYGITDVNIDWTAFFYHQHKEKTYTRIPIESYDIAKCLED